MDKLAQCTPANFRKFTKKFLESSKGNGPYVDCLNGDVEYHPKLPCKTDFFITTSNLHEPTDDEYDPLATTTERIYLYVEPIYASIKVSSDANATSTIIKAPSQGPIRFDWTSTGQRDLAKAYHAAELLDTSHKVKRDQIVAQLLALMSPESTTLLSNIEGFALAVQTNDLWKLFKVYLPHSHDRVSTSAVHKRTRDFLTKVQMTTLPDFIAEFRLDTDQFKADWESDVYPGYVKIDGLLRNAFVEGVKGGPECDLLKPALEALALSRGSHRDASLQTAFDALSSYHIRNKRHDVIETSIAFTATAPPRLCSGCNKSQCLSSAALTKIVNSIHKGWQIPPRLQDDSGPGYCEQCIRNPPRCKCGKPRSAAWKLTCDLCWKQKKSVTKKDQGMNNAGSDHRVNVAASSTATNTSTTPPPQPLHQHSFSTLPTAPPYPPPYYPHLNPQSIGHHPQHFNNRGWIAAPHQQIHQFQPPLGYGSHGSTRPPNMDDDSLSDYSYSSQSNHMFVAPLFDWQWFDSSSGKVNVHEAVQEQSNWGIFSGSTLDLMRDQHTYYVDSAASMHCTDNLLHLINVRLLKTPIRIKGISKDGWVFFTHVGDLPWLPLGM